MSDPLIIAIRFLKFRPRTVFEVTEKLKSKGISETETKKIIAVLKKNELLNDENFAKMWVRDRNNLKPTGAFLLKLELKKLGISDTIITSVLAGQNEEELAKRAIESKSRYRNADFSKQASFLQRRGFSMSVICKVLKK